MLEKPDHFHFFRVEVKAYLLDEKEEGKWLKARLCPRHTRVKHLSLFPHLAKSCSYLDWTGSSFFAWTCFPGRCTAVLSPAGHAEDTL